MQVLSWAFGEIFRIVFLQKTSAKLLAVASSAAIYCLSKLIIETLEQGIGVVLASLLLTLNMFHTLFDVSIVNLKYVIAGLVRLFEFYFKGIQYISLAFLILYLVFFNLLFYLLVGGNSLNYRKVTCHVLANCLHLLTWRYLHFDILQNNCIHGDIKKCSFLMKIQHLFDMLKESAYSL